MTDAPISSKQKLIDMLTERSRKHDAFRLAETAFAACRADGYGEEMNAYDVAHGAVLDWLGDNLDELLGFLRGDETPAPQNMHSDEWWQAELDRCVGVEQAKYRALFAALEGVEALTRYATGTGPDQQRLAKVCRIAQGVKSPDTSPAEAGGEYCACLQGVCMGPDHTDKLCKAEKASGEQS